MTTIKFSKALGQVEVISTDADTTTVVVLKTGEVKKLLNKFANLSDIDFVKSPIKKTVKRDITNEEKEHLDYLKATGNDLGELMKKSTINNKNGKSGLSAI